MSRKILLSKLLKIKVATNDVYLICDKLYKIAGLSPAQIDFILRLKSGIDEGVVVKEIENKEIDDVYKLLLGHKWIVFETEQLRGCDFNPKTMGYLSAFVDSPSEAVDLLAIATVCIIGLGGVGSVVLENLVASGVRNYILIDYDKVCPTNLNRQYIYARADLGESKVAAAKNYILERNPTASVTCFEMKIDDDFDVEFLKKYKIEIMVGAADFPRDIDVILSKFCFKNNIPFISGSVAIEAGGWGPLMVPGDPDNIYSYFDKQLQNLSSVENDLTEDERVVEYSFGPTNSIISTFLARDIVMFLLGARNIPSLGRRVEVDFVNMRFSHII